MVYPYIVYSHKILKIYNTYVICKYIYSKCSLTSLLVAACNTERISLSGDIITTFSPVGIHMYIYTTMSMCVCILLCQSAIYVSVYVLYCYVTNVSQHRIRNMLTSIYDCILLYCTVTHNYTLFTHCAAYPSTCFQWQTLVGSYALVQQRRCQTQYLCIYVYIQHGECKCTRTSKISRGHSPYSKLYR